MPNEMIEDERCPTCGSTPDDLTIIYMIGYQHGKDGLPPTRGGYVVIAKEEHEASAAAWEALDEVDKFLEMRGDYLMGRVPVELQKQIEHALALREKAKGEGK